MCINLIINKWAVTVAHVKYHLLTTSTYIINHIWILHLSGSQVIWVVFVLVKRVLSALLTIQVWPGVCIGSCEFILVSGTDELSVFDSDNGSIAIITVDQENFVIK